MSSDPALDWRDFEIEESGAADGCCECCGTTTKRVWGFARCNGKPVGAYFVAWTQGRPDHGAKFDLILGQWGRSATKDDRYSVALDYRLMDGAPQFMIVDVLNRVTSGSPLVGTALKRSNVIGTAFERQVFTIVDAVYMSDSAGEIRRWTEPMRLHRADGGRGNPS
jgi:hypothetical protein